MRSRAAVKCPGDGLYDRTCCAVMTKSNATLKCLRVSAIRSSSTFDRIPRRQPAAARADKASFVSENGLAVKAHAILGRGVDEGLGDAAFPVDQRSVAVEGDDVVAPPGDWSHT